MKKLILILLLGFIFLTTIGHAWNGDGMGPHKAFKHLNMDIYDVQVTSITAKDSMGVYITNAAKTHGLRIDNIGNTRLSKSLIVGEAPASIEAALANINAGCWIENDLRIGGSFGARAAKYGLAIGALNADAPDYIHFSPFPTGSFSTGTAVFTDDTGPFLPGYVDKLITITYSIPTNYPAATGKIIEYIDASNVKMAFPNNGNIEMTGIDNTYYVLYNNEFISFWDGGSARLLIGDSSTANFEIKSDEANNSSTLLINTTVGSDGHSALKINIDPDHHGSVAAAEINIDATDLQCGANMSGIKITADTIGSCAGEIRAIDVSSTDSSTATVIGLVTSSNVEVIHQHIGTSVEMGIGIVVENGVYKDSTTAFGSNSINVPIFTNNGDSIIIGASTPWDISKFVLDTFSAPKDIDPSIYFSTGGTGGYTEFPIFPQDGTDGMTKNGAILMSADTLVENGWSTMTVLEATNGDSVNPLLDNSTFYFIQIYRNEQSIVTTPIESLITIETIEQDYYWDKDGNIHVNTVSILDINSFPDIMPLCVRMFIADGTGGTSAGDLWARDSDGNVGLMADLTP